MIVPVVSGELLSAVVGVRTVCLSAGFYLRHNYNRSTLGACSRASTNPTWKQSSTCPSFTHQVLYRPKAPFPLRCAAAWTVTLKCIDYAVVTSTIRPRYDYDTRLRQRIDMLIFFDFSQSDVACFSQSQSSRLTTSVGVSSNFVENGAGKIVWFRDWKLDRTLP